MSFRHADGIFPVCFAQFTDLLFRAGRKLDLCRAVIPFAERSDFFFHRILKIIKKTHIAFFFSKFCNFFGEFDTTFSAIAIPVCNGIRHPVFIAQTAEKRDLFIGIEAEFIESHDHIQSEFFRQIAVMFFHIFKSGLHIPLPVHFHCFDGGDHHGTGGFESALAAFDVNKFFCSEIGTESGFRHHIISQPECGFCGSYGVAAVRDIGKRSAVDHSGRTFKSLHQIGTERIPQKCGHGTGGIDFFCKNLPTVKCLAHNDFLQIFLEFFQCIGKAEHRHDFRRDCDAEMILPRDSVGSAAKPDDHIAQHAVVHIHAAFQCDGARVDIQRISLLDVIIHHGAKQIVCGSDRVKIPGEMQVDIFHGDHLGITAARCAAFHAENRTERGFPQSQDRFSAGLPQRIRQTDGDRSFAVPLFGGSHGGDKDQFSHFSGGHFADLGFVFAVLIDLIFRQTEFCGDLRDPFRFCLAGDFNICFHREYLSCLC